MQKLGKVTGIDFSSEALYFAKKRGIKVKKASVEKLPFKDNTFDVVISIDVLNHKSIKNDLTALSEIYRVLKPNGITIIRIPANSWMHLNHDRQVHMKYRINKNELLDKLLKSGFIVEKLSFINLVLFPLSLGRFIWEKTQKQKKVDSLISNVNPLINILLIKILLFEAAVFKKINLPIGIGLMTVSRKPKPSLHLRANL